MKAVILRHRFLRNRTLLGLDHKARSAEHAVVDMPTRLL